MANIVRQIRRHDNVLGCEIIISMWDNGRVRVHIGPYWMDWSGDNKYLGSVYDYSEAQRMKEAGEVVFEYRVGEDGRE